MTEKELNKRFTKFFEQHFNIRHEVNPDNSRLKIDIILDIDGYEFGVELKKDKHKQGNKTKSLITQANGYANLKFNGRRIPILVYPSISDEYIQKWDRTTEPLIIDGGEYYRAFHHKLCSHHNMNGIISFADIGEVRKTDNGWYNKESNTRIGYSFMYNNKMLWHENNGIHEVNYNYILNKLNK
jgi:hypothetical protein